VPVQVSYPGVYVNIVATPQPPTGGASTSIGAFLGRAPMGLVGEAVPVLDFADYTRKYGGLNKDSAISYQANAFFSNGGEQAVIVRLYKKPLTTTIEISDTPTKDEVYEVSFSVNGGPQPADDETPSYTAQEGDDASKVATGLASDLQTKLQAAVNASVTATATAGTIVVELTPSTTDAKSDSAIELFLQTPKNLQFQQGAPSTIGQGTAQVPVFTSKNVWVPNATADDNANPPKSAAAAGDYALVFTPLGGAAVNISYTATAGDADIAQKLVDGINNDRVASNLVTAAREAGTGAGDTITLTYKQAVEISEISPPASAMELSDPTAVVTFEAASPGVWGNELTAFVEKVDADNVNLTVYYFDGSGYQTERFLNVTFEDDPSKNPQRVDKVLANGSQYLRWTYTSGVSVTSALVGNGSMGADSAPLDDETYLGDGGEHPGVYALEQLPYGFNIVCVPPDDIGDDEGGDPPDSSVYAAVTDICVNNNAMLIMDPPKSWYTAWAGGNVSSIDISDLGSYSAEAGRNAAVYFPRVVISDPLMNGHPKVLPPCGFVAAAWAATDNAVGVWKAPAGLDVPIGGIIGLQAKLTDDQNGVLNPQGINALRVFSVGGDVAWGARTLRGADVLGDEYKYIPVRRLALYIASSMLLDTKWAVFQPNGDALWAKLGDQVGTFMSGLFSQGAFAGTSADQAFFVKCDKTTTTPADQAAGIVNVQIGFAPLYPAEFVVITVSQKAASSG
jgi:hypothetical protein